MKAFIFWLAGINEKLAIVFRFLAWTFLALMTVFIIMQSLIFRKLLNSSLFWPEDVSLMMMIWVAFAVAPIAYRMGANVSLDMIARLIRGRASYLFYLLVHLLVLIMLILLINEAYEMIERSKIRANSIPVPMKYIYLIIPIGFGAMVLVALELGSRCLLGIFQPDDPAAQPPKPAPGFESAAAEPD